MEFKASCYGLLALFNFHLFTDLMSQKFSVSKFVKLQKIPTSRPENFEETVESGG